MWDETGLDGSVWPDLAGKWNPSSNRDDPDGLWAPEPAKTGHNQNIDKKKHGFIPSLMPMLGACLHIFSNSPVERSGQATATTLPCGGPDSC